MTALSNLYPTLLDVSRRLGPDGKVASDIVEILDQTNDMWDDAVIVEGNLPTGTLVTIRDGIPEPTFRKLYGFVPPGKSTTTQVTESCGMLEAFSVIDAKMAELNGLKPAWMLSEQKPYIEGFNQKIARYLIYGNEATEPEGFTGLAPRYNSLAAENGCNIVLDNRTVSPDNADNTSLYVVLWSPETCFLTYPKGSKAGLSHTDDGLQTETDSTGAKRKVYQNHYKWDLGMCVKDWRYVVRIQINQEDLTRDATTGPKLLDLMDEALDLIPNMNAGRPAIYCNRRVRSFFRSQTRQKAGSQITMEQLTRANGARQIIPTYDGIPIRRMDSILNTETGVSLT